MKYKFIFGILGVVMILGGIGYVVCKLSRDKNYKEDSTYKKNAKPSTGLFNEGESNKLQETKSDLSQKTTERHEEAEKMIRESVENIFEDEGERETTNEKAKKKLFDDLNEL